MEKSLKDPVDQLTWKQQSQLSSLGLQLPSLFLPGSTCTSPCAGVSPQDGTSDLKFSLTHKGKDPPHVGPGLLEKAGVCFMLLPLSRNFKRLQLFWGHRIPEWVGSEGTTVDHVVPPLYSRVIPELMAQDCIHTVLEYLQWGRAHSLSGQCVPLRGHLHSKFFLL